MSQLERIELIENPLAHVSVTALNESEGQSRKRSRGSSDKPLSTTAHLIHTNKGDTYINHGGRTLSGLTHAASHNLIGKNPSSSGELSLLCQI